MARNKQIQKDEHGVLLVYNKQVYRPQPSNHAPFLSQMEGYETPKFHDRDWVEVFPYANKKYVRIVKIDSGGSCEGMIEEHWASHGTYKNSDPARPLKDFFDPYQHDTTSKRRDPHLVHEGNKELFIQGDTVYWTECPDGKTRIVHKGEFRGSYAQDRRYCVIQEEVSSADDPRAQDTEILVEAHKLRSHAAESPKENDPHAEDRAAFAQTQRVAENHAQSDLRDLLQELLNQNERLLGFCAPGSYSFYYHQDKQARLKALHSWTV